MKFILNFLLYVIDFFNHKKKILKFLKKSFSNKSLNIIDIGAHHGETLKIFVKHFKINQIICYEASKENFLKLNQLTSNLRTKKLNIIKIFNKAIGDTKRSVTFNQTAESSSTFQK